MSLRDDLMASLIGDATLMALLPGGVHTGTTINRQDTPSAFDTTTKEIKPCLLLRLSTEAATGPAEIAGRMLAEVYAYARLGYAQLNAPLDRVYILWHKKKVGDRVWQIMWTDDVSDQMDDALNCALSISRFAVYRARD